MKQLILTQKVGKSGKYIYQVWDNGKMIASRKSERIYVACYVVSKNGKFEAPFFFGKTELIGKGDSAKCTPYAIATIAIL